MKQVNTTTFIFTNHITSNATNKEFQEKHIDNLKMCFKNENIGRIFRIYLEYDVFYFCNVGHNIEEDKLKRILK